MDLGSSLPVRGGARRRSTISINVCSRPGERLTSPRPFLVRESLREEECGCVAAGCHRWCSCWSGPPGNQAPRGAAPSAQMLQTLEESRRCTKVCFRMRLSCSFPCTHSHTHSFTHTHTDTITLTLHTHSDTRTTCTRSHNLTHSHAHILTYSHAHPPTHSLIHSHTLTHTQLHTNTQSHILSGAHTLTPSDTHIHTPTDTHTHSHTHSHSDTHSHSYTHPPPHMLILTHLCAHAQPPESQYSRAPRHLGSPITAFSWAPGLKKGGDLLRDPFLVRERIGCTPDLNLGLRMVSGILKVLFYFFLPQPIHFGPQM